MTALAFVLPFYRVSPLYIARRDIVAGAGESVSLTITLPEFDDPPRRWRI